MPWKISKRDGKYCVTKESDGSIVHCHETEAEALAQQRALYAGEKRASSRKSADESRCECGGVCEVKSADGTCSCTECAAGEIMAYDGFEAKAIGDDGQFCGYLMRWGDANRPDASTARDFFTQQSELGRFIGGPIDLLYHHGLPTVKGKVNTLADVEIGESRVTPDGEGGWLSGRLNLKLHRSYPLIGEMWDAMKADDDAFGLSSGAVSHRVTRVKQPNGTHWLKRWWICEASITPDPAERRTAAVAVKSLESPYSHLGSTTTLHESTDEASGAVPAPHLTLVEFSRRLVADQTEFVALATKARDQRIAEGRDLSTDKIEAIKADLDGHERAVAALKELLGPIRVRPTPDLLARLARLKGR
jgi:hypothetical protein